MSEGNNGAYIPEGTSSAADKLSAPMHTPGPLSFTGFFANGSNMGHVYLTDVNGRKIASLWGRGPEKIANAHLYSAAPDLLEDGAALLELFCAVAPQYAESTVADNFRESMAKATGADGPDLHSRGPGLSSETHISEPHP